MKKESLANKAYLEIRRKILTTQVQPNTRLKEDFWAKKLSVSRMAIREALTRLLGEGLVSLGPKGGYFVNSMEPKDIVQIRELREILEIGALRLSYSKITKEQIKYLEKICDDYNSMVQDQYLAGAAEADLKFHETLMEYSGNIKLLQTYINSHIPLFHQKLSKSNSSDDDFAITDKEHRAIIKAIKEKNIDQAEKAMRTQFARGASLMEKDLE